jgi:hypothetical protein
MNKIHASDVLLERCRLLKVSSRQKYIKEKGTGENNLSLPRSLKIYIRHDCDLINGSWS